MTKGFDFGLNWERYSARALTNNRVAAARVAFAQLTEGLELKSSTLLDVGFGQGLASLCAATAGASVHSLDVNPRCWTALENTAKFFAPSARKQLRLTVGSILSEKTVQALREKSGGGFHIVYAWGVLHHTGDLEKAFANCVSLLRPGGCLIVAIYNRHWSSPIWRIIKRLYCSVPVIGKKTLVGIFTPIIFLAKLLVTRKSPTDTQRGMDFFIDIVDWVGGYPYEYASVEKVRDWGAKYGLNLMRINRASVPTGCNEFVFLNSNSRIAISTKVNQ